MRLQYVAEARLAGALALTGLAALGIAATAPAIAGTHGARRSSVSEIIVHATGGPFCLRGEVRFSDPGDLARMKRFFDGSRQVSIHYIVGRDGAVATGIPESEVAIHTVGHNEQAIGIELINAGDGREAYPEVQVAALAQLVAQIRRRWRLPLAAVKGHEDVDHSTFRCAGREVRRKQDPGSLFPWERLRRELTTLDKSQPMPVRR